MRKINLGSGPASAKGWINYDWGLLPIIGKYRLSSIFIRLGLLTKEYDWRWPKLELVNIKNKLPDKDRSVDYIYCSNVLEHFEKSEALDILNDCRRVLKSNGLIRIVVPDLKKLMKSYKGSESFNREYFGFDKDLYVGFIGKIKRFFIRGHEWMYDRESGINLLKASGFKKIKVCSFRRGECPNINILDLEMHRSLGLYIEASN